MILPAHFLALQSLSVLLFMCLLWHLCRSVSCIFHISAIQRVAAGFCSMQPLGYFHVLHLESHTVWIHLGSAPEHIFFFFLINTIANSFVARNGPKSFLRSSNALTAFRRRFTVETEAAASFSLPIRRTQRRRPRERSACGHCAL